MRKRRKNAAVTDDRPPEIAAVRADKRATDVQAEMWARVERGVKANWRMAVRTAAGRAA